MTRTTYQPEPDTDQLNDNGTEAGTVAALALAQHPVDVHDVHDDADDSIEQRIYGRGPSGESVLLEVVDLEARRGRPRAVTGDIRVHTPDALIAYTDRHLDEDASTLWVDAANELVTVVLNDHAHASPGWADHRVSCKMVRSPEFAKWAGRNDQAMSQEAFGDFLEERLAEVVDPDGSTLLEVARTFQATTNATFSRSYTAQSGQVQLTYREEIDGKAGANGQVEPPAEFAIQVRLYEGTDPVRIRGKFFYRITSDRKLALSYRLLNLDEVLRDAFGQVGTYVKTETGLTIIEGVAPAARR